MPFIPLRPSHCDSILTSVCGAYSASTQPVSRSVAVPLPQTSSGPENVVLLLAFWQLRLVTVGSLMVKVLPDWVVLSVALGPFQAPVPLPCGDVLLRADDLAGGRVDVDGEPAVALGAGAGEGGFPVQGGRAAEGV